MKILKILLCWLLVVSFSLVCLAQKDQTVPRFEKADCAVSIPQGEKAECGYLFVKERRAAKNDKTIRLPIIILTWPICTSNLTNRLMPLKPTICLKGTMV